MPANFFSRYYTVRQTVTIHSTFAARVISSIILLLASSISLASPIVQDRLTIAANSAMLLDDAEVDRKLFMMNTIVRSSTYGDP